MSNCDKKRIDNCLKSDGRLFSVRNRQCFLLFIGIGISAALKSTLSVTIVSMTYQKNATSTTTNLHSESPQIYNWTEQIISLLLSGYSWGSFISQIPGGQLSKRYGGKYIFLISIFFASSLTLLTPYLTQSGDWIALAIVRAIEGFFHGFALPALYTLLAQWVPEKERGRLCIFTISGQNLITTIMMATSGYVTVAFGWQFIFYIWGCIGVLWSILWQICGSSSPSDHKTISVEEKQYIKDNIRQNDCDSYYVVTPWKKIFKSLPFYAVLLSQCSGALAFQITILNIPRYLHSIFRYNLNDSGLFSSLIHLVRWLANFIYILIDYLFNRNELFTLEMNRKFFNSIGQFGPGLGFIVLAFAINRNYEILLLVCLISIPFLNAATGLGNDINHIDLAPNHAGVLLAICNLVMGVVTIGGTNMVGAIVTDAENQSQWQIIFLLAGSSLFVGGFIFIFFASTSVQVWNDPEKPIIVNEKA